MKERKPPLTILIPTLAMMFLFVASEGMVVPLLAPTLASPISPNHDLLAGYSQVLHKVLYGVFMGIYPVFLFIFAPILGAFADATGRKRVLMICLFLGIISTFAQGLGMFLSSLTLLFLGRIAISAVSGCDGAAQALLLDRCSEKNKSRYIGYTLFIYSIGFLTGPALAGIFISKTADGNLSFAEPFYAMALGFTVVFVWLYFALASDKKIAPQKIKFFEGVRDMSLVFKDKRFKKLTAIFMTGNIGGGCYAMTIPIYLLENFGFSERQLAWYMAFGSFISGIVLVVIAPFLVRRFDKIKLSNCSYLFGAVASVLAFFADNQMYLWICSVIFTFGFCVGYSACLDAYSELVGERRRAWILSVVLSIWGLASGGGLVLSSVGISINTRATLAFTAIFLAASFVWALFLKNPRPLAKSTKTS